MAACIPEENVMPCELGKVAVSTSIFSLYISIYLFLVVKGLLLSIIIVNISPLPILPSSSAERNQPSPCLLGFV